MIVNAVEQEAYRQSKEHLLATGVYTSNKKLFCRNQKEVGMTLHKYIAASLIAEVSSAATYVGMVIMCE